MSVTINRNAARPLHEQVADDLRRRIGSGEFAGGVKLPSLRSLTEAYGVSEVTVHTAIRELQRDRLVTSTAGRGTFIVDDAAARVADIAAGRGDVDALRREVAELRERVEALERRDD